MKPFLLLTSLLSLGAAAQAQSTEGCFHYAGQTLQSAAEDAIWTGALDDGHGDLACLKTLVNLGANLRESANWHGDTSAVAEAVHVGNFEVFDYILSLGVEIKELKDPQSAANLAEKAGIGGSVPIMQALLARGLPLLHRNSKWPHSYQRSSNYFTETCSPALYEAASFLRADLVKFLLGQGLSVNDRCDSDYVGNSEGFGTPLMVLANTSDTFDMKEVPSKREKANETLKVMIDAGADVNAREDFFGNSAAKLLLKAEWISPEMESYVRAHIEKK